MWFLTISTFEVVGEEPLDVAQHADRDEHHLGLDRLRPFGRLDLDLDAGRGLLDLARLRARCRIVSPRLVRLLLQRLRDLLVLAGQDPVQQLDDA